MIAREAAILFLKPACALRIRIQRSKFPGNQTSDLEQAHLVGCANRYDKATPVAWLTTHTVKIEPILTNGIAGYLWAYTGGPHIKWVSWIKDCSLLTLYLSVWSRTDAILNIFLRGHLFEVWDRVNFGITVGASDRLPNVIQWQGKQLPVGFRRMLAALVGSRKSACNRRPEVRMSTTHSIRLT